MSVHLASVVPIKKRRFPVIDYAAPPSPPRENPSVSGENPTQTDLPDLSKPSASVASGSVENHGLKPKLAEGVENHGLKPELAEGVESQELKPRVVEGVENQEVKPKVVESTTSSERNDDLRNKVSVLPVLEKMKLLVSSSSTVSLHVPVKQEIAGGVNISEAKQNVNVPLETKEGLISALEHCKSGNSKKMDLGLVLSKEKPDMSDSKLLALKNLGNESFANRSNWDLNTNIEEWAGSSSNGLFPGMRDVSTTRNHENVKPSLIVNNGTAVGLGLVKGEPILSGQSSNSGSSFLRNEPDDSLGLSLGAPYRGLDASGNSFLCIKPDAAVAASNLSMKSTVNFGGMKNTGNFGSFRSVKLEPITEVSRTELSLTSSSGGMELSNSSSVKKELVEKPNPGVVSPSSISPQKLDDTSIKPELIHERSDNVFKFDNSIIHQYGARFMQHQESTASSSAMNVPLTPQNLFPSKSPTSGDQHQFSFHSEEALGHINQHNVCTGTFSHTSSQDGLNAGNSTVDDSQKLETSLIDGCLSELCGKIELAANDDERLNLSTEMLEDDTLGSDSESCEKHGVSTPPSGGQRLRNKEDGDYEEGEVRTPLQHASESPFLDTIKPGNVELGDRDPRNLQPFVLSGEQSTNTSDFDGKSAISETHSENIKECVISDYGLKTEANSSQKLADNVPELKVGVKRSISVIVEKQVDLSRQQNAERGYGKEVTGNGASLVDKATDMVNKQICSAKNETPLSNVEALIGNDSPLIGNDTAKESNNFNSKSRIITLPRASVASSPYRTRSIPNRLLASYSGNERYSDLDGDMQPRGNRHEFYTDKFEKDSMRDPSSYRNSRLSFTRGRGRGRGRGGRFGPSHNDWDSDNDFASETYNGPSGYRGRRPKHTSFIPDAELEHRGYRRKAINDEKFMGHLPDETIDSAYNRPQNMYDEFDGQFVREKQNFSTIHRKVYTGIDSTSSPVRSRTRSPGPWPSRRRRSPESHPELNQNRSPPLYRMRRMRSPERASYREEMVPRKRVSPSFITRSHSDDMRDVESVPEHVHPTRSFNTNRRSPPARVFQRTARREVLESREREDVNIEERRKFIERRGGLNNSFRPSYSGDGDNFHFHPNEGSRAYRFCPDGDTEFAKRSNMREREFDGRMKHQQPLVAPRRVRDVEEQQQDGTYRPAVRVWHEDGFNDASGPKRRRF